MECMDLEGLPMHCPPHHFMVPAVLLTACALQEGKTREELEKLLTEADKRAKKVLGGFCGNYGNCGVGSNTERKDGINMAKSKLVEANEKIAEGVTTAFHKMTDAVVGGYKKIEDGVVGGFTKIEDGFIDQFLTKEGESVEEARARLQKEQEGRQNK